MLADEEDHGMGEIVGYKNYHISMFDYMPEISQDSKRAITYKEIYDNLFRFTCNDLMFINLFNIGPLSSKNGYSKKDEN